MKIKPIICLVIIIVIGLGVNFKFSHKNNSNDEMAQINTDNTNINEKENTKSNSVLPLTNSDFVIMNDKNYIELDGKYKDFKTDKKVKETKQPDENHAYYIYVYEDFKIHSDGDEIASIDLKTSVFQTSRGIKLGDTILKVIEKYGNTYMEKTQCDEEYDIPGQLIYSYDGKFITFFFDKNNKIVGIRLEIL